MEQAELLRDLVTSWMAFSQKRAATSLNEFARWLLLQTEQTKADNVGETGDQTAGIDEKKMQIGYLFGQLSNFADLWGKLAFQDLPIRRFEDYGLLKEIQYKQNPTKNELANYLVNEKSTVFEIIKRLVRDGLLTENIDEQDKRVRRVSLTEQGYSVVMQADEQAGKVAQLLVGDSTEEELDFMIRKFSELNSFHQNLHQNQTYHTIDDLLD